MVEVLVEDLHDLQVQVGDQAVVEDLQVVEELQAVVEDQQAAGQCTLHWYCKLAMPSHS